MSMRLDKLAAQGAITIGMLDAIEKAESRMPNILRILAYHRIGDLEAEDGSLDSALLNTTPAQFSEQMAYLKQNYHIVSVEELLRVIEAKGGLPPRSVMITFDDGYRDFKKHAWPVLKGMQVPAVLFVATSFMDGKGKWFWWDILYNALMHTQCSELVLPPHGNLNLTSKTDRELANNEIKAILMQLDHKAAMELLEQIIVKLRQPKPNKQVLLNWEDLRVLRQEGLTVAAHTRSHPILSRVDVPAVRQEVSGSLQDLVDNLGETPPIFAYPVGHQADLTDKLPELLRQEGIRAAVTMLAGHNRIGRTDPLKMRRVGMAPHMNLNEFRLVLTGFYNVYGAMRSIWKGKNDR